MTYYFRLLILLMTVMSFAFGGIYPTIAKSKDESAMLFITRKGDFLYEGDKQFRFISIAAPTIHINESQLHFDGSNILPDEFETRDVLSTLKMLGGQVTRPFTFSVLHPKDPVNPSFVLGRRIYNEEAFRSFDQLLALCHEYRIRLIIPFLATQSFPLFRGVDEFSAMSGKMATGSFFTEQVVRDDFKDFLRYVLNRRNTVTGVLYKDDPVILAWQLGNEYGLYAGEHGLAADQLDGAIADWSRDVAAFLKANDAHHLVMEGGGGRDITTREALANDPNIDVMSIHLYEHWRREAGMSTDLSPALVDDWAKWRGRKPLIVDEFGMGTFENLTALMQTIKQQNVVGGLLWGMRGHHRDGGFYFHNESGTRFNSYHYPGFATGQEYDETRLLGALRREAYAIRGMKEPPVEPPQFAPVLAVRGGGLVWRGSTGASGYDIERAASPHGPWVLVAAGVSDAAVSHVKEYEASRIDKSPPFWFDESGKGSTARFYRVRGRNIAGQTPPSNIVEYRSGQNDGARVGTSEKELAR